MKTRILHYAMLLFALFATSCASTVDEPIVKGGDVTLTVRTPAPESRAGISVPSGYSMKCVLQLLDNSGNKLKQKTEDVNASTGTASFTITSEERAQAKKALLWAHYVKGENGIYNTSDLKAVTYNTTNFDMTDAALMAAMDAFCGIVESLDDDVSVTLSRPFANVRFSAKNPEACALAKKLVVTYTAPASYSVLSRSTTAFSAITLSNSSFDSSKNPWFSAFVFAPSGTTSLGSDITLALSEGLKQTITLHANSIPLDINKQINVSATIGSSVSELDNITISVSVNPDFDGTTSSNPSPDDPEIPVDPDTPIDDPSEFAVGAYINAKGEAVSSKDNAVAIVFHAGALGSDNGEKYGDATKTIKGYAIALDNISDSPKGVVNSASGLQTVYNTKSPKECSDKVLDVLRDAELGIAYTAYVNAHVITAENTSGWLIPDYTQLSTWLNMLYPFSGGASYTGSSEFRAKFSLNNIFGSDTSKPVEFISRTIPENNTLETVVVNPGSPTPTLVESTTEKLPVSQETFHIRPILVIFE